MSANAVDMAATIAPKSDQLNADDLLAGARTITITGVRANPASPEQPVDISFEGDGGKPYKPCKSMRRVLVHVWGADARQYVGRSMTLYCDPKVQFGGMAVGGIRISHMSHVDKPQTMALTATRAKKAPFTVQPLQVAQPVNVDALLQKYAAAAKPADVEAAETERAAIWKRVSADEKTRLKDASDAAKHRVMVVAAAAVVVAGAAAETAPAAAPADEVAQ